MVLGLMLFLAGTAFCSTDSYDPNPYDDIPPIVTVEFNYVVPGQMGHAVVRTAFTTGDLHALGYIEKHQAPALTSLALNPEQSTFVPRTATPGSFVPLRR